MSVLTQRIGFPPIYPDVMRTLTTALMGGLKIILVNRKNETQKTLRTFGCLESSLFKPRLSLLKSIIYLSA